METVDSGKRVTTRTLLTMIIIAIIALVLILLFRQILGAIP